MNRVSRVWMVAVLVMLGACAPVMRGNRVDPPEIELSSTIEMPSHLHDGETVALKFTLANGSDAPLYVLMWYTPLVGIGGEIFSAEHDGQVVPYRGILATRGDPTPEAYIKLEAGQSASAEVDLAAAFGFSRPGAYTVKFLSPRISHVAWSVAEMARSVDDLGPVAIPSNTVTVWIEGSSSARLSW